MAVDNSIFDILRKQEEEMKKKPVFFVHYDPVTTRIINIRNYVESTDKMPYIEMTLDNFDFSAKDFDSVKYTVNVKEKTLEKITTDLIDLKKIDDFIYEIPKIESNVRITYADRPFDLLIEQNNPLKEFRVKLSKLLRDKFILQNKNYQRISVYVTATNDPNILHKTLQFTFGDLIQNEYYTIKYEDFDGSPVNIYAFKYFEDYLHVDIR